MKRAILLLLLSALLIWPQPAAAQMSLPALRVLVDNRLATMWQTLLLRQTIHYQSHGFWFQGMITHGAIPADGSDSFLDNTGSHPTDQLTNWQDFLESELPSQLPMAITIDVYDGGGGSGFTACVWVYAQGELYSRCKAIGPEAAQRTVTWYLVS